MIFASTLMAAGFIVYVHGAESSSWLYTAIGVFLIALGIASGIRIENDLYERIEKLEKGSENNGKV